ncbi:hypothetical protein [uncultured Ruthenibacterium sp.]|uniref:hypothetical protein n=1 Tax=uncultured Ruthenibacterium sp. TaxID=1905347 RepID=UPI00349ECCD1
MTGKELFEISAAYLSQNAADSEDAEEFAPHWLNVLLAEALPTENQLRAMDGREPLSSAPVFTKDTMDNAIPYSDAIVEVALPYGLASELMRDDDNDYRCQDFRQKYILALGEALRVKPEPVRDLY